MTRIAHLEIAIDDGPTISASYTRPGSGPEETAKLKIAIPPVQRRTIEFLITLLRADRLKQDWEYEVLGSNLFAVLFMNREEQLNEIGQKLQQALWENIGRRAGKDSLLRITLKLQEERPDLSTWPWEYLYKPKLASTTGFFFGHRARLALTRYFALADVDAEEQAQPPLRVLLVTPSSDELPVESTSVIDELQRLHEAEKIRLVVLPTLDESPSPGPRRRVTADDFQGVVANFDPHVIHFLGHGKHVDDGDRAVGKIAFTDEEAESAAWYADEAFANFIDDDAPSLQLVFLQACESANADTTSSFQTIAGMAQSISSRNVPAVVAMHYRVANQVGNALSRAFYESLAEDRSVLLAINRARQGAKGYEGFFGVPVLYLRGSGEILAGEGRPPAMHGSTLPTPAANHSNVMWDCPWDDAVRATADLHCVKCGRRLVCPECGKPRVLRQDICGHCQRRTFSDADRTGYEAPPRAVAAVDRIGEPLPPERPPRQDDDGHHA